MSNSANVQSSEAIVAVKNALIKFVENVTDALATLNVEMQRVQEWLEHDRPRHWKWQIHKATDDVNNAQAALHRCLMFPAVSGERPSCYEEREILKRAQAREVYCRAKAERVKHWMRTLQHEVFEYEGRISQLVRLVEIDAPRAIGTLEKILRHLEEYNLLRTTQPQAAYSDLSMAREIWPAESTETETPAAASENVPNGEPASAGGQTAQEA